MNGYYTENIKFQGDLVIAVDKFSNIYLKAHNKSYKVRWFINKDVTSESKELKCPSNIT